MKGMLWNVVLVELQVYMQKQLSPEETIAPWFKDSSTEAYVMAQNLGLDPKTSILA